MKKTKPLTSVFVFVLCLFCYLFVCFSNHIHDATVLTQHFYCGLFVLSGQLSDEQDIRHTWKEIQGKAK